MDSNQKQARHAVIDTTTGELYDIKLVPRRRAIGGWVKLFQRGKRELLLGHPNLRGQSLRVLAYLETVSSWHNLLPSAAETAMVLSLLPPNVSRAYSELTRAGFIVKLGTRYHLSPLVAWKGTEREWDLFCRELYEPKLLIGGSDA